MPRRNQAALQLRGLDLTDDVRRIDEEHGLALLYLQRRERVDFGKGPVLCVGGLAQVASVTRDEVSTRILERWPDRVGERITA